MSDRSVSPPPLKRTKLANTIDVGVTITISSPIVPDGVTIYSWNVNGIASLVQRRITTFFPASETKLLNHEHGGDPSPHSLRDVLRRYRWPTMLLLQELKMDPGDLALQRAIECAVRPGRDGSDRAEPSYVVRFCLPSNRRHAHVLARKVYGVCSIIRRDFYEAHVQCIREVDWDADGRFLVCETAPAGLVPRLAIINVYAVNGTDAPYRNYQTGQVVGSRHDRKLEVHRKLQQECQALEARGFGVVVAGDLNVARSALDGHPRLRTHPSQHAINRADFEARFFAESARTDGAEAPDSSRSGTSLNMVDTFRALHPTRRAYTYYPRMPRFGASCDRVDMILISQSLRALLIEASMHETPTDRATSDHVPLFAKLALQHSGTT